MSSSRRSFISQCSIAAIATTAVSGPCRALVTEASGPACTSPQCTFPAAFPQPLIDRQWSMTAHGWLTTSWRIDGNALSIDDTASGGSIRLQTMHGLDQDFEWYELDRADTQQSIASACGTEVLQELCQSRGIALLRC